MITIVVANQKGGVGKTTSVIDIAAALAEHRKKVLVIDLDQSRNLSKYMRYDPERKTINEVLRAECNAIDAIQHMEDFGFDLIASSPALSRADRDFVDAEDPYLLADVIDILRNDPSVKYDYVLVDNSPSRSILLTMSYVAADQILIATDCDEGSIDGCKEIYADVEKLRSSRHALSHARILGIILTRAERITSIYKVAREEVEEIAASIPEKPFVMDVRKAAIASEAKFFKVPIRVRDKNSNPALDYDEIAKEIIKRTK